MTMPTENVVQSTNKSSGYIAQRTTSANPDGIRLYELQSMEKFDQKFGCFTLGNKIESWGMSITIRPLRHEDARSVLEVQRAAVHGIASRDYPADVVASWAPLPITDRHIENFLKNPDNEIRLVAEMAKEVVGIGAIVLQNSELRACYVSPGAARKSVGSALVREIECIAVGHGLTSLQLHASVTSEPFYSALGYTVQERGEHILSSGHRMAYVKMKHLKLA